jgi:hypothetical protein
MQRSNTTTLLRGLVACSLAGVICAGAEAQDITPEQGAQLLADSLNEPGRPDGLKAAAHGRFVEIDQVVEIPAKVSAEQLRAGMDKVRRTTVERNCRVPTIRKIVDYGITLIWRIRKPDQGVLAVAQIDKGTCAMVDTPIH